MRQSSRHAAPQRGDEDGRQKRARQPLRGGDEPADVAGRVESTVSVRAVTVRADRYLDRLLDELVALPDWTNAGALSTTLPPLPDRRAVRNRLSAAIGR